MRKLIITDVGPITQTASIEYNRFCILIGPQSNGKSTIAKILSTCMWLEKEACTSLSTDVVEDGEQFKRLVEDFHRMHDYIHPDRSIIEYQSPYVRIRYDKGAFSLSFNDNLSYKRLKISYIPSDRNVVTMKDIEKRDLEPTNFRSFLFDWLDTNRHYDIQHRAPVLNLDVQYYFDEKAKDRKDKLVHKNGVTYSISLYDASSGLQSLVPMTVLMHYLVSGYFDNYGKDTSFEQQKKISERAWEVARIITTKYYPDLVRDKGFKEVYDEYIWEKAKSNDEEASKYLNEMIALHGLLSTPDSISFILEEPEQNLFPKTQVDLFNDIILLCNAGHPSSVFLTTHSPYLLSAANILLFAGKLMELGVDKEELIRMTGTNSFIFENEFSAYTVSDGTCHTLIDDNTHLIKENELDTASDYNSEVFDKLYQSFVQKIRK